MGRNGPTLDSPIPVEDAISASDLSFPSRSGRSAAAFKRQLHAPIDTRADDSLKSNTDRRLQKQRRNEKGYKKGLILLCGGQGCLFFGVFLILIAFVVCLTVPRRLTMMRPVKQWETVMGTGSDDSAVETMESQEVVRFYPKHLMRRFQMEGGIEVLRSKPRFGVRPPRLGIVLGTMKIDPSSLMLLTLAKSLRELGYTLKIFAVNDGEAHSLWKQIGFQITILNSEGINHVDWSLYEGIVLNSLETKDIVSSLKEDPFSSVPLIWIIQEDTLAKRLSVYADKDLMHLVLDWKSVFKRADVVVFPDFSLPMMHTALDTGNFFVVPGSPVDVWSAELYFRSHSKDQLRLDNGFKKDEILILVTGSSFFFTELPFDYAAAMHVLGPQLTKLVKMKGMESAIKFLFLCGNSTDNHDSSIKELALHLGFPHGSVRYYSFDNDVNGLLLLADVVLHASFQDEQNFPSLLMRAMSFGIPIIAPDLPIMKKYIVDKDNGLIYLTHDIETLMTAFSLLISDKKMSSLAHAISKSAKFMSKNMFASQCIVEHLKLLENVIILPSYIILPLPISQLQQKTWEWSLFEKEIQDGENQFQNVDADGYLMDGTSIVRSVEKEFINRNATIKTYENTSEIFDEEFPTELDWEEIQEIERIEESDKRELEELDDRIEKPTGTWENIYNAARKSERMKFEGNERDEGELERFGSSLCIYEMYNGVGAWPFLHHGSIYRGLSLSKKARRPKSDDVDAVARLPLLDNKQYSDLICELGGMLSIANKVDNIHKIPWIGFQSWRAVGRKVSLTDVAEKVLEETITEKPKGDVVYFWSKMKLESKNDGGVEDIGFWSLCDILNGGNCRTVFENTFRNMYGLSINVAALPPMPSNGDQWSALNSWVMPTPSFIEFIMFSRLFLDSLHNMNTNHATSCLLGSSKMESKHCYCQLMEHLVNVWAYHSARKMVYIDPSSGELKEQHPIELRKGRMWVKYFSRSLLKSMDEDLAEEADDGLSLRTTQGWIWPLTGEVYWQGILQREREEKYRQKMDKRKKHVEKLIGLESKGNKQKALGVGR